MTTCPVEAVMGCFATRRLCVIVVFEPVDDSRNRLPARRAEFPPTQFIRQDHIVNGFQQARTKALYGLFDLDRYRKSRV